jgi:tetratricopeptide (TPR) repeat protein
LSWAAEDETDLVAESLFVGRRDEIGRFAALLGELPGGSGRTGGWWRRSGDICEETVGSRVVLVHGLGGSGKSRLLEQFRQMADGVHARSAARAGRFRVVWLDWEDAQRDQPGLYAVAEGPALVTVLDAVRVAVTGACGPDRKAASRAGRAFAEYRQGAVRMPQYAARFADVIEQSGQAGSGFSDQDAHVFLRCLASVGLAAMGHPGGIAGLGPDQLAAAGQAVGHLSEAAVRAVTGKKAGEISPQEYDLVTDPARELTRRMADALRDVAGDVPLVIMLDTGEVLGETGWGWLRRVMTQTGPRVSWVVGARFETEAEAGSGSPVARFVRDIGDQHLVQMSPSRFDDVMIGDYLQNLTGVRYADAQVDQIARFTRGLPLAVSLTAALLAQGQPVEQACREIDGGLPGKVVSDLARRYLVHAEKAGYPAGDSRRDDLTRILGLALAYGDVRTDPDMLATLWDADDPLAAFTDLACRHDFVLPVSRRLHDNVRDTLRADLLDPYRRAIVRPISQRALDLCTARLNTMRARWPSLDEQLSHDGFARALLAALWHTLWADNQAGLDLFIQILPVMAVADPATAAAALDMAGQFAVTFDQDQRRDFGLLAKTGQDPGPEGRGSVPIAPEPGMAITAAGLALCARFLSGDVPPVPGGQADRQAAVLILKAALLFQDHQDPEAVSALRAAAAQTTSVRLRQAIGNRAHTIASRLSWARAARTTRPAGTGLEAAKIAVEMLPGSAYAWNTYGTALYAMRQLEKALGAYEQALTLDPGIVYAHNGRGNALHVLARHQDALAAYDQALTLDPGNVYAHNGRGNALYALGRHQDALAAYDQALTLDPGNVYAHNGRGNALQAVARHEDAVAAYDQALTLDPGNVYAHNGRGNALHALGRHQDAVAAYDQAAAVKPRNSYCHEQKGIVLAVTGDLDSALAELETARNLAPHASGHGRTWAGAILWHRRDTTGALDQFRHVAGRINECTPYRTAEMEAIALCAQGHPSHAEQHLLAAIPTRTPGEQTGPGVLYDLLSDPPLPGIDRLRAIVDSQT